MLSAIIDFFMRLIFGGSVDTDERRPWDAENEGRILVEEPAPELPPADTDEPTVSDTDEPEPPAVTMEVEPDDTPVTDSETTSPFVPKLTPPKEAITVKDPSPLPEPEIQPPPPPEPVGVMSVGAWVGQASFRNPARDVKFCVDHNIDRLQIIVNDHSGSRSPRKFDTYDQDGIVRLAKEAKAAGIDVQLMTWMMPHRDYIDRAVDVLLKLLDDTAAIGVEIDAEEPWTLAQNPMAYEEAAFRIGDRFRGLGLGDRELGVNHIGYTPISKVGPLVAIADYSQVQAYATSSNRLRPETVVPKLYRRTRDKLKPVKIDVGLAAYRQTGIIGHTPKSAMTASLAGAQAIEGVTRVTYWSLRWIRRSRVVAQFIKGIDKALPEKPSGGAMA